MTAGLAIAIVAILAGLALAATAGILAALRIAGKGEDDGQ